jgi:glutamate-1-semialdehyde aminotransferase
METMIKDMVQDAEQKMAKVNPEKKEGKVARTIEEQTAKIPSDAWLWTALGTAAASLALKVARRDDIALFVGLWVPSFLLFGIYNKLVKQMGHDDESREAQ